MFLWLVQLSAAWSPEDPAPLPPAEEAVAPAAEVAAAAPAAEIAAAPPTTAVPPAAAPSTRQRADDLYLVALAKWKDENVDAALDGAEEALRLDPGHGPARLLKGYCLLRLGQTWDGVTVLRELSDAPRDAVVSDLVREDAAKVAERKGRVFGRDQYGLSLGVAQGGDAVEYPAEGRRVALAVDIPVRRPVSVRLGLTELGEASDYSLGGPELFLLPLAYLPIGHGALQLAAGAGPAVWLAQGPYWKDHRDLLPGARATVAADIRWGSVIGFREELSGQLWLRSPAEYQSFQASSSLVVWFGS